MRRRKLIAVLGCAAFALPIPTRAKQKGTPVIGWLHSLSADRSAAVIAAFKDGLDEAGYIDGRNVAIEYLWAEGHYDRLPALAADLVGRRVDVIVTGGGTPSALAAKAATSTTPIVFTSGSDPVEIGLVASIPRPGGNVTGIDATTIELMAKRLELLSDLLPRVKTVGLLVNPRFTRSNIIISEVEKAVRLKALQLEIVTASSEEELDAAFSAARSRGGALVVGPDPFFFDQRPLLAALAARHGIPAIFELRQFADAGGLISYGTSLTGIYRQAAGYVARILKGAKPADLPVQQPTRFELVINLKTARALGLTVPQSLLARADEVIE